MGRLQKRRAGQHGGRAGFLFLRLVRKRRSEEVEVSVFLAAVVNVVVGALALSLSLSFEFSGLSSLFSLLTFDAAVVGVLFIAVAGADLVPLVDRGGEGERRRRGR